MVAKCVEMMYQGIKIIIVILIAVNLSTGIPLPNKDVQTK